MTTLLEDLATRLAEPVPGALRERAARHLLDWLGCAIAGAVSEPGRIARDTLRDRGDVPLAGGGTASARTASLVNGALGNVLEMDDVHRTAILHPGPVVIPAALALAEGGAPLLDAIVRGYEAMIRIGRAVGPAHYAYFHNTATCGPFGSAAAAASALGLDIKRTVWAMANAGSMAGGLWQLRHEDTHTKQLHAGRAAEAGVTAALLSAQGFRGPATLLDGEQGFLAALCPDGDGQRITERREGWLIEEVSFKPWPACRHAHPAIDAALAMRGRVDVSSMASFTVATYADALRFCDRPEPRTPPEARFSLQHAVAVTLLRGAPDLSAFEAPAIRDDGIVALRRRVQVMEDPHHTARFPEHYGARLTAGDPGKDDSLTVEAPDALGDPALPLSSEQLRAKATMLMKAGGQGASALALVDATLSLPNGGDLRAWRALVANA